MIHFKRQIFKNSIVLHSNLGFSKVFLLFHPCSANRATILAKEANTLQMISAIAVSAISPMHPFSIEDMKRMYDTNFWGAVYGTRLAVQHYKSRGVPGAVINIGSLFGDRGTVIQSTYASSKFALHGFTESIRMELEKEHAPVSITLVHPGRIDTPYNEHARSYL